MRVIQRIAGAAAATGVTVAIALGGVGAATPAGAATSAATGPKATVTVGDNFFKADDLEVTAGTKVTWVNKGKILHSIVPDKGKAFGTRSLGSNKKYSYTFKKPGTYAYYCAFHGAPGSGQHGTIVVKAAAPTTTTTAP